MCIEINILMTNHLQSIKLKQNKNNNKKAYISPDRWPCILLVVKVLSFMDFKGLIVSCSRCKLINRLTPYIEASAIITQMCVCMDECGKCYVAYQTVDGLLYWQ